MKIDIDISKRVYCGVTEAILDISFQYFLILFFVTSEPKLLLFQVNLNFERLLLENKTSYAKSPLSRRNDGTQQYLEQISYELKQ